MSKKICLMWTGTVLLAASAWGAADATWTNAAGDNDVSNPTNWTVTTEDGKTASVLPDANTAVSVPYSTSLPDFSSVTCKSLVYTFSGNVAFPRGSLPPAVVKTAVAWYDLSDDSTVTADDEGVISAVSNKGTAGATLDGEVVASPKPLIGYARQNGLRVMTMTNACGFVSKNASGVSGEQDRTIIGFSQLIPDTFGDSSMYTVGIDAGADAGAFRLEDCGSLARLFVNNETLNLDYGYSTRTEWRLWTMMAKDGVVSGSRWDETAGLVEATPSNITMQTSAEAKIYVGYRGLQASHSAGSVGEAMVFTNALTEAERTEVQDYVNAKWLAAAATLPGDIVLNNGSVLDLNYQTCAFSTLSGSGTIANGALTSIGTLNVTVNENGTIYPITLSGMDFDASRIAVINVTGADYLKGLSGTMISVTGGTLSGTFTGKLVVDGNRKVDDFDVLVKNGALKPQCQSGVFILYK